MSPRTITLTEPLYEYLTAVSVREPEILRRLREETAPMPDSQMQVSPEQGQFMALLVELMAARRALEIGVYTGYSSLCVARALPEGGRVIACDINEEWTAVARRYWREAGVAHKIDVRLAPALETLEALLDEGQAGSYDFTFIDAEKEEYDAYYERVLTLTRPGGLITIDNVLWSGSVADPAKQDKDTNAIRALNKKLHQDERISLSLVPIGDGLTLALKR
ncbi:MAG: class I SAM-dependent methyltransferase [Alphaproteobacteria bacterium]